MILFGKPISKKIFDELHEAVKPAGKLAVVQVGSDPVSSFYVKKKQALAEDLGVNFELIHLADTNEESLIENINKLNRDPEVKAVMLQIPLPSGFDREKIASTISAEKDIDGFSYIVNKPDAKYMPPTVLAIDEIMDYYGLSKSDKEILIVGEGFLVGRPLNKFFKERNYKTSILLKDDPQYLQKIKEADIVILATGAKLDLDEDSFKDGATVIDASTVAEDGNIRGDVKLSNHSKINLAPVPGGVGPLTLAMLFRNFFN